MLAMECIDKVQKAGGKVSALIAFYKNAKTMHSVDANV